MKGAVMKDLVKLAENHADSQLPTVFLMGVALGASFPLMFLAFT